MAPPMDPHGAALMAAQAHSNMAGNAYLSNFVGYLLRAEPYPMHRPFAPGYFHENIVF